MTAAYVPEYSYDVFVSYAHVDDQVYPGNDRGKGWVTTLVEFLQGKLDEKLGRPGSARLWMDRELRGNEPFPDEISDALRRTATLLVILSEGYVASDWCRREWETFLDAVAGQQNAAGRIFVVFRDEVPRAAIPALFRNLLGYQFFEKERDGAVARTLAVPQPDPRERAYYDRLNDLRGHLSAKLKQMKFGSSAAMMSPDRDSLAEPAIFLAEVTPDLVEAREELGRYLVQEGMRVLPTRYYNRAPVEFCEAMDRDLASSILFAQLLGPYATPRTEDNPSGYEGLQLERALEQKIPVLRWRSRDLNPDSVRDLQQRKILQMDDVQAMDLEEFKSTVLEAAKSILNKRKAGHGPPAADVERFVMLDSSESDLTLAQRLAADLSRLNLGYDIIDESTSLDDLANSEEPDAIVVIYGQCPQDWVQKQVRACRRVMLNKKTRAPVCAIYLAPPEPKPPLGCRPSQLKEIRHAEEATLRSFLDAVIAAERSEE